MPYANPNVQDDPEQSKYYLGFPKGLNLIQEKTLINDKNLTLATNVMLVVDGITRRYGTSKVWDQGSATKVYGHQTFYKKSAGTKYYIRIANGRLQYLNGAVWTNVSSQAYTNIKTRFVQASNKMFIYNGTDPLTYFDGSTITTYTALAALAGLAVTPKFSSTIAITSITRSSQIATLTSTTAHNLLTGDYVTISGAAQAEYNGTFVITVTTPTTFTYTVTGTPATPATGTLVLTNGGATAYSYRVAPYNAVGEGAACARVTIANGYKALSTTNFNQVDWTVVPNALGYNIYGRHSTGTREVYLTTVPTNTYNDTGVDTETTNKIPPEDNTTGGIKAQAAIFTLGRQFAFGVTEGTTYYPTRLYYSGTINNIDTFNSSEIGGGWVEIDSNNGGEIVDIKAFDSGVLVFKNNAIFKFYFTSTGLPALQEVTRSHGGVSFEGSQFIDNDYMFVAQKENRIAVMTIGFQAAFNTGQLRTNEVSIFIADGLTDINRTYLSNICAFRYDNKFAFAYTRGSNTENDVGYVVDTRFGGWVKWDGDPMKVTSYAIYDDGVNAKLYGASNSDGYMIEMFKTARNDNGVAFISSIGTKFFNNGMFDIDKIFRNPVLWFKYIDGGSITAQVYVDGNNLVGTAILSTSSGGAGFGMDLFGSPLFGSNYSQPKIVVTGADVSRELTMLQIKRSIGFYLIDSQVGTNWLFMGLHIQSTPLQGKPLQQSEKVRIS